CLRLVCRYMQQMKKIALHILQLAVVLLTLATITFALMKFTPGDPVDKILHLDEANISQVQSDETREHLGLNESVGKQYLMWVGLIVQLALGECNETGAP